MAASYENADWVTDGENDWRDGPDGDDLAEYAPEPPVAVAGAPHGIDVSKWQSKIDWHAVATDGVAFAIIKASEGPGWQDKRFADNWAQARAIGLPRGPYHYLRTQWDPVKQAEGHLRILDKAGGITTSDLPPTVDVEEGHNAWGAMTALQRAVFVARYLARVERGLGVKPIIYTSARIWGWDKPGKGGSVTKVPGLFNDLEAVEYEPGQVVRFGEYPLWNARWSSHIGTLPNTWKPYGWTFWQFSAKGKIPGIGTDVDLDVFNPALGGLGAWIASRWTGRPVPAPAPVSAPPPGSGSPSGLQDDTARTFTALAAMAAARASGVTGNGLVDAGFYAAWPSMAGRRVGDVPRGAERTQMEQDWRYIRDALLPKIEAMASGVSSAASVVSGAASAVTDYVTSAIPGLGAPAPSAAPPSASDPGPAPWRVSGLTPEILQSIEAKRNAVPLLSESQLRLVTWHGKTGLQYVTPKGDPLKELDRRSSESMDRPASDGTLSTAQGIVWRELSGEGDFNSFGNYDGSGATIGRGFAADGLMPGLLWNMFQRVPEYRRACHEVGIDSDGTFVYVVNVEKGKVVRGADGFRPYRYDRRLPSFFINLGKQFPEQYLEAQLEAAAGKGALNIPSFAWSWPKPVLQFVGHCVHWQGGIFAWKRWKETGGDIARVLENYARIYSAFNPEHKPRPTYGYQPAGTTGVYVIDQEQAANYVLGERRWKSAVQGVLGPPAPLPSVPAPGSYFRVVSSGLYRRLAR